MKTHDDEIRAMFSMVQVKEGWGRPRYVLSGIRDYRGKRQYVAGYAHSKIHAHHANGLVYDRVIGWGESQAIANEKMRSKLTPNAKADAPPSGGRGRARS